jgi:hypothetical protein
MIRERSGGVLVIFEMTDPADRPKKRAEKNQGATLILKIYLFVVETFPTSRPPSHIPKAQAAQPPPKHTCVYPRTHRKRRLAVRNDGLALLAECHCFVCLGSRSSMLTVYYPLLPPSIPEEVPGYLVIWGLCVVCKEGGSGVHASLHRTLPRWGVGFASDLFVAYSCRGEIWTPQGDVKLLWPPYLVMTEQSKVGSYSLIGM